MADAPGSNVTEADYPRRFSWPMRIFLCLFLFDMVARSFIALTPYDEQWAEEVAMEDDLRPPPLPTPAELRQIRAGEHPGGCTSATASLAESFASLGPYFSPWPDERTRQKIDSPLQAGKYAVVWIGSRFWLIERILGVDQDWAMFSPNVGTGDTTARCRLVFADGSERYIRLIVDPADLTNYSHGVSEKWLQTQGKVHHDADARRGFCNYLAHRHPTNDAGSPLLRIYISKVRYEYPDPYQVDTFEFLRRQSGPPEDQIEPPFYYYDVAARTPYRLRDGKWEQE